MSEHLIAIQDLLLRLVEGHPVGGLPHVAHRVALLHLPEPLPAAPLLRLHVRRRQHLRGRGRVIFGLRIRVGVGPGVGGRVRLGSFGATISVRFRLRVRSAPGRGTFLHAICKQTLQGPRTSTETIGDQPVPNETPRRRPYVTGTASISLTVRAWPKASAAHKAPSSAWPAAAPATSQSFFACRPPWPAPQCQWDPARSDCCQSPVTASATFTLANGTSIEIMIPLLCCSTENANFARVGLSIDQV